MIDEDENKIVFFPGVSKIEVQEEKPKFDIDAMRKQLEEDDIFAQELLEKIIEKLTERNIDFSNDEQLNYSSLMLVFESIRAMLYHCHKANHPLHKVALSIFKEPNIIN